MNNIPKQGDIYRHYKGNFYEVLLIAKHTETEEDMVIYRSTGPNKSTWWARPLSMWNETIMYDGKTVPRFKKVVPVRCNYCDHYEGVHKVQGVAPCLKHNKMTLWSDLCDNFNNSEEE